MGQSFHANEFSHQACWQSILIPATICNGILHSINPGLACLTIKQNITGALVSLLYCTIVRASLPGMMPPHNSSVLSLLVTSAVYYPSSHFSKLTVEQIKMFRIELFLATRTFEGWSIYQSIESCLQKEREPRKSPEGVATTKVDKQLIDLLILIKIKSQIFFDTLHQPTLQTRASALQDSKQFSMTEHCQNQPV